ncbi:MAG: transglycosylase SLT domain-containing protein [Spirochaetes bacterium]|jgi:membrane-bound lytic murein transglycosylase D|nr:transglycosylase SLT domain-containing protein [Spirochaetota bacterium]
MRIQSRKKNFALTACAAVLMLALPAPSIDHLYAWSLRDLARIPRQDVRTPITADKTAPPSDEKCLFDAVNDLSICDDPEVRRFIHVYLTRGRPYVVRAIRRSRLYLDEVDMIVRNTPGAPPDIALLPLLESGYSPRAVSRSKAVGLWQFLGPTAKILKLQDDAWVDERRDVEKSTIAAMRHLANLQSVFGSWDLALAAYNGGAGHVRRAMNKTRVSTLAGLNKRGALRKETSEYVARYAALLVIYRNQDIFGIADELGETDVRETGVIELEFPAHIGRLARVAGTTVDEIRALNPQLKTVLTPIYERAYRLKLPAEAIRALEKDGEMSYAIKFTSIRKHVVRRGESINLIARRYNSRPESIILINNIQDPARLRPGKTIYIPI